MSLPHYDRVTSETSTDGTKNTYYWDNRYTYPVHIERERPLPTTLTPLPEPDDSDTHEQAVSEAMREARNSEEPR